VAWEARSAVDGHGTSGELAFAVGDVTGAVPAATSGSSGGWWVTVAGWAFFAGYGLSAGGLVWRRLTASSDAARAAVAGRATRLGLVVALAGATADWLARSHASATSTLLALALFESEALPEELPEWRRLREQHLESVRRAFDSIRDGERILLFCHDPSALPFLWREESVRARLRQVERTIVGHLHSKWVMRQARWLSGMPRITFLGHTPRRLSTALREARHWAGFKILLCPSPAGLQLFKDGGYLTASIDPSGRRPAAFEFHPFRWESREAKVPSLRPK